MSDPNDNPADVAGRADELFAAIRAALAPDASAESKTGAANAARAILRGLDPQARTGAPPSLAASMLAGTPLGAALGAISSLPREQLVEFLVSGVRSIFSHSSPTYRARPATPPSRETATPPSRETGGQE